MLGRIARARLFVAVLTLGLVLAACGGGGGNQPEGTEGPKKVHVVEAIHTLLYLPLYVADSAGIFEDHGIDLELTSSGAGPQALSSVIAGEAQFSIHGPEHVAFANAQGGKALLVSGMANSIPLWMLAKEDMSLPDDLIGKSVAVGPEATTPNVVFTRYLKDHGISVEQLDIQEVTQGTEVGPTLGGRTDVAVTVQPSVEQGIAQGLMIVHDFTAENPEFVFSGVATTQQVIDDDREMVQEFVAAIDEALQYMRDEPEEAVAIAEREFPEMDAEVVAAAVDRMTDSNVYPESAEISEAAFKKSMELQVYMGNLKEEPKYEELVSTEFAP